MSCPGHRARKEIPTGSHKRGRRANLPHQTRERSSLRDLSSPGHRACAACSARVTGQGREHLQETINAGGGPTSPTKPGSEAPCATCPARVTGPARLVQPGLPGTKKQPSYWTTALSVGENLFFRAVTSQVSSAPASLTSVFGMGTGGPSRQSTPTVFTVSLDSSIIIPHSFRKCKP